MLREVKVGGAVKATYTWLADGSKLRVRDASGNGFDYMGSLTYTGSGSNLSLESASFPGGVIKANQEINYFLTDHLGSVRAIVDWSGNVKERNDYYAFGAKHIRSDYPQSDNRYDYNGKEEQTTGNLRFLDYGARMYDNRIGRWFNVDPLAEDTPFISPYTYCYNNPVGFIDLFGLAGFQTTDPEQIRAFLDHLKGGGDIDDYDLTEWDDYIDVHVTLPPVVVTGVKPLAIGDQVMDPLSGFWDYLLYIVEGDRIFKHPETRIHYSVDVYGKIAAIAPPLTGTPPGAGLGRGVTLLTKLPSLFKAGKVAGTAAKLTPNGLRHIMARHAFSSGAKGAGKFMQNTTNKGLESMIKTATSKGVVRANTMGRTGTIAEYDFGIQIGFNSAGQAATRLRVVVNTAGEVITAFPY